MGSRQHERDQDEREDRAGESANARDNDPTDQIGRNEAHYDIHRVGVRRNQLDRAKVDPNPEAGERDDHRSEVEEELGKVTLTVVDGLASLKEAKLELLSHA